MMGRSEWEEKERCCSSLQVVCGLVFGSGCGFLGRRLKGVVEVVVLEQAERRRNLDRWSLKLFLGFSI